MSTTKNVNLPDIGDFDSVDVIEILVKIGDLVKENDSIITLETDKATMEIPAPFSGKVTNLAIKVGDKVSHGDLILTVESDSEPAEIESEPSVKSKEPKPEVGLEDSTQAKDKPNKLDQKKEEISLDTEPDSHASPSIRKLARELGVSLSKISGSGQKGRILAEDLKSYVKQIVTTGSIDDEVEIIPLSRIKKISGKHLTHSWTTIPHVTQFDEVNIEQMEQFRQHQKERNIKLSPLVFIMKAVVQVLKNHPNFNASLDKNGENLVIKKYFNLDGRSGAWTFKPMVRVPLAGEDDYEIYDNEWGNGIGLGYEFETAQWYFGTSTTGWVFHGDEPFESHSSLDLGYNFEARGTNGSIFWESDFHWEDDGSETLSAGPALYWNVNDTVHWKLEWKHDFHDRQGVLDHGNGDVFKFSLGFVF